jgi:hypothetical protein
VAVVACVLLVIAEFSDLNTVHIGTTVRAGQEVGDNHSHALLILALVAGAMAFGAWSARSRPAAFAVAALGAVAVLIVVAVDGPDTDAKGTFAQNYADVTASAATGFRLELVGAVLLLFAGVAMVVFHEDAAGS